MTINTMGCRGLKRNVYISEDQLSLEVRNLIQDSRSESHDA